MFRAATFYVAITFPDSPFRLAELYKPAGDQPEAIARLEEGLDDGLAFQTLLGVTGSGKTFTIANVVQAVQRPTLVLAPNKTLAAQLYGEFKDFFPHNAVEYFVSYYDYYQPEAYIPQRDIYIEKDASRNDDLDRLRLSATSNLVSRRDSLFMQSAKYGVFQHKFSPDGRWLAYTSSDPVELRSTCARFPGPALVCKSRRREVRNRSGRLMERVSSTVTTRGETSSSPSSIRRVP